MILAILWDNLQTLWTLVNEKTIVRKKMKQFNLTILLAVLVSMVSTKALAYDVAVENEDGKTIYYNYITDGTELEVTYYGRYSGDIKIPETVTILNKTRKVTSIGRFACG